MKILTHWLRSYLPEFPVDDAHLAEDLTLRGIAVEGIFPTSNASSIFDMDITTNRVDAMNHYGIAREAAAIYNLPIKPLLPASPATTPAGFPIRIDAPALCGRFTAQIIRDVRIAPTAGLVADYFTALGVKQISNAVDISNFVLLGMGHPNHVFDLDKIEGGIIVRLARPGESLKLLDGTTRTLTAEDLVIADHARAISLAGVMGGFDTMITAETRNILVEAAWFDPAAIRATSRRHLIHTDASHRYERGADFAAPPIANALVAQHILAACGGNLEDTPVDIVIPNAERLTAARPPITLSVANTQRLLGPTADPEGITAPLIHRYLTALGCNLHTTVNDDSYEVTLPSWRLDLTREIDLIEEVARVHGYNRFADTLPTPSEVIVNPHLLVEKAIRSRLLALGYTETISTTFAAAADSAQFAPALNPVALENPLSEEALHLRPSLLPGMIAMLAHNMNRDVLNARLFEAGAVFSASGTDVKESLSLSLGITGSTPATNLYPPADAAFGELKGALESLLSLFAAPHPEYTLITDDPIFEPGRAATATLAGSLIARFGELSRHTATQRKLRQPVFLAEIDLEYLLTLPFRQVIAREISRFQAVERDFSFTFPDHITWGAISAALTALNIGELQSIQPVELWRDSKKYPGVYSTLTRTVFQPLDRTLTDAELQAWSALIVTTLQALGGTIRT